MKKSLVAFWGVIAAALLSACGGGGGSPVTPSTPSGSQSATVQFSITESLAPSLGANGLTRQRDFNAVAGAQSVTITLTSANGSPASGPSVTQNLATSASGCTSNSSQLTCTVSMKVPAGNDVFTVVMYPQPDGKGTPIATGTLSVSAAAGQTVTAPSTLTGTVASIQVSLPASNIVPEGQAASLPLSIVAKDANGNVILGAFANPITLTDNDPSGATSLSATTVSDGTTAVLLKYNGGGMAQAATITASAQNASPASVSFSPNTAYPAVNQSTLTYGTSENGIGGGGILTSPPLLFNPPTLGTMTVTVSTGATFNGRQNLTDFHIQTSPSPLPAVTSDEYYSWSTGSNAASLLFIGSTSFQPSQMNGAGPGDGTSDTITCKAPYSAAWIVPFPQTWDGLTGTGPCTEHRTAQNTNSGIVDVDILDRTLNADGSYTAAEGYSQNGAPEVVSDTRVVNADGTGTQNVTWGENIGTQWVTPSAIIVMQTPAPASSTLPYLITNFPGPIPSPGSTATPSPTPTTMPNWYAMANVPNGMVPSPLATTTFVNKGVVAGLPSACAVPLSLVGASVPITEIDQTHTALDPFQSYEIETSQYFLVDGIGTVCIEQTTLSNGPGSIYLMPPFAPGGSYDTFTAYLTSTTLQTAIKTTRSVKTAMPFAQAGLFALVRAHHESVLLKKAVRR